MALLSSKLDQLFILLVPDLVRDVAGTYNFPDEVYFVQNSLSVWSHFAMDMNAPLRMKSYAEGRQQRCERPRTQAPYRQKHEEDGAAYCTIFQYLKNDSCMLGWIVG
jgi:hypothetical protein